MIELLLLAALWDFDLAGTRRHDPPTMGALEVAQAPAAPSIKLSGTVLFLAWNTHPDPTVIGFRVYRGTTPATTTVFVLETPETSVQWSARELELHGGDDICFKLTAYNADGESDKTPGVCATLPGATLPG